MARCFVASAPGTGPITLGAFVPGYQTFASAGVTNGTAFSYNITDYDGVVLPGFPYGSETGWEVGATTGGSTLTRSPLFSSNGNSAINASANAQVWITALATDFASIADTTAPPVTAAGNSPGTATALFAQFSEVLTVSPGTGVIIPTFMAVSGQKCRVASYGANALVVYPLSGQSFMSGGVNNGLNEGLRVQVGIVLELETGNAGTLVYSVP